MTHFVLTAVLQILHTAITVEDIEKQLALITEKLQNEINIFQLFVMCVRDCLICIFISALSVTKLIGAVDLRQMLKHGQLNV
jgi:hypothetical protein